MKLTLTCLYLLCGTLANSIRCDRMHRYNAQDCYFFNGYFGTPVHSELLVGGIIPAGLFITGTPAPFSTLNNHVLHDCYLNCSPSIIYRSGYNAYYSDYGYNNYRPHNSYLHGYDQGIHHGYDQGVHHGHDQGVHHGHDQFNHHHGCEQNSHHQGPFHNNHHQGQHHQGHSHHDGGHGRH